MPIRFSEYFNLGKTQSQLEFVDIPLDTDILLFVEPYAFAINEAPWYVECHNLIVQFFQALVNAIRSKNYTQARHLLSNLGEPNETRLGFSNGGPQGRGYGGEKIDHLLENLKKSKAVHSGLVTDIAECELLVPKVGNDTISDMVTNILRRKLIEFTEEQCQKHNIPTEEVNAGVLWNDTSGRWESEYRNLPTYEGTRIILVPKKAVRFSLTYDHKDYKAFVLDYLRKEHLEKGSSLVKVLQNGNREVYKKDILNEFKDPDENIKEFLQDFTATHPEAFEKYKRLSKNVSRSLSDFEIELAQPQVKETEISQLIEALSNIPPGKKDENSFHNLILKTLEVIFTPFLSGFQ
jgi:DNA-binding protein YbaB